MEDNNENIQIEENQEKTILDNEKITLKEEKEADILLESYKSLSPTATADNIGVYKKYIEKMMHDKNNYNIAISGGYGAGKSSIIKTYFENNHKNVITVSLGSYIEQEKKDTGIPNGEEYDNNKEKNKLDIEIDKIETSILQQILYCERPSRFPNSRISRIDKEKYNIKNVIISFIISLIIIILYLTHNYDTIQRIAENEIKLRILCIALSLIFVIVYIIVSIFERKNIRKVSINGVELSKEESEISVLNRNIDELIYFFMETKYNIVVFEDIDRLHSSAIIFSKLKEINAILNTSLKNKRIIFIYAVGDTVFSNSEKRTKFFDAIIPIVPYSGIGVSKDIFFNDEYKKLELDEDIVKMISRYVTNPRIVYDIINEYIIYNEVTNNDLTKDKIIVDNTKKKLLALCGYKVLYPKKFDMLLNNKGKIAYYFSEEFDKDINKEQNKQNMLKLKEIEDIEKSIKMLDMNPDKLFYLLEDEIKKFFRISSITDSYIIYNSIGQVICGWNKFKNNPQEYYEKLEKNEIFLQERPHSIKMNEKDIFKNITKKDFVNLNIYKDKYQIVKQKLIADKKSLEKFNIDIENVDKRVELLESMNLPKEYNDEEAQENIIELNNYEKWLIKSKNLEKNYKKILTKNNRSNESEHDNNTLNKIMNNIMVDYEEVIENINLFMVDLSKIDFINDSICIKAIFEYIIGLPSDIRKDYLNYFYNNISSHKIQFILKLEEDRIPIMDKSNIYYNDLIKYTEKYQNINNKFRELLMCYSLKYYEEILSPESIEAVIKFFSENNELDYLFNNHKDLIYNNLKELKLSIKQKIFNCMTTEFAEYVRDNDMYGFNFDLIEAICNKTGSLFDRNKILSSLDSLTGNNKSIAKKVFSNIDNIVNDIFKITQSDEEKIVKKIIEENALTFTDETKEYIILNEKITYNNIEWIESNLYSKLLIDNKIKATWNNMNRVFESKDNKIILEQVDFINHNIDILLSDESKPTKELKEKLLYCESIKIENYEKLIRKIYENFELARIPSLNRNYQNVIIKNHKIGIDDCGVYKDIINNETITDEEKSIILIDNFKFLKEYRIDNINNKILMSLFNSELDKKDIIEFFEENTGYITGTIQEKIFDICLEEQFEISPYFINHLLTTEDKYDIMKMKMYLKYSESLENVFEMNDILPNMGQTFKKIVEKDFHSYQNLDKDGVVEEFSNKLKTEGIISNANIKDNKIRYFYKLK